MKRHAVSVFTGIVALITLFVWEAQVPLAGAAVNIPAPYLPDVTSWLVTSSHSKRTYQISVALPDGYSKNHAPYPVLFAADANAEFGTVVEAARLLRFEKQIPDLVIVGIGYANPGQGFKASFEPRALDLSPTSDPAMVELLTGMADGLGVPAPKATGGATAFLGFIRNELVPQIQARYNVSREDRAWFGHSIAGLFGVYALLNNDGLFKRFLIGSPSLWWDDKVMFKAEEAYAAARKAMPARVYFAVGAEEEAMPGMPMVSNLQKFSAQLKMHGYYGLDFTTQVFDGETHGSVIPTTISSGLRYIYAAPSGPKAR